MGGWSRVKLRQWWWIVFAFGVLLINYPFLNIFNRPSFVGGFPILFLYFFVGWAISVGVIAVYVRALHRASSDDEAD